MTTRAPETARTVELADLWAEMWEDLRHNATGKPTGAAIIAKWRVVIEGAIRGERLIEGSDPASPEPRAPTLEIDHEAGAAYVRLTNAPHSSRTVELSDDINVDLDAEGRAIGVELLNAATPVAGSTIPDRPLDVERLARAYHKTCCRLGSPGPGLQKGNGVALHSCPYRDAHRKSMTALAAEYAALAEASVTGEVPTDGYAGPARFEQERHFVQERRWDSTPTNKAQK